MQQFRTNFLQICRDNHLEPQENVLSQLKSHQLGSSKAGGCLNLSTLSLSTKTCAVLAKCLAVDRYYTDVKFSDCMIGEEGIKCLALGLSDNVTCVRLDLKGNNVKGAAADSLGKMLRDNKVLRSLCLEWNQICMVETSFAAFCEGLGCNTALHHLDMRSNQISHNGAQEIAGALRRNSSLKSLDIRWNNIGITGGRAIHNALQHNKTLTRLQTAGNNIPNDLMRAIDTAIIHNMDSSKLSTEYTERQRALTRELRDVKKDRDIQLGDLLDKIELQEEKIRKSSRSSSSKVKKLEDLLEERKAAIAALQSKLAASESELALSEQKMHSMENIVAKAKQDNADLAQHYQNEARRSRDDRALTETRILRELQEANDQIANLTQKVDELERKVKQQQQQLYDAREQNTHAQAELKLKTAQFDEKVTAEKQRSRDCIRDAEQLKLKELGRAHEESRENERQLREKIQRLEMNRVELEEELGRSRTSLQQEKLNSEEQITAAKTRIRGEEDIRHKQLEERLRVLTLSRDELHSQSSSQQAQLAELQTKNANLSIENESLKRRVEDLSSEVSSKQAEIMEAVARVRNELAHKMSAAEADRAATQALRDEITKLETHNHEYAVKQRQLLADRDAEISGLTERVRARESEIARMRADEQQRAAVLVSAVNSYCAGKVSSASA